MKIRKILSHAIHIGSHTPPTGQVFLRPPDQPYQSLDFDAAEKAANELADAWNSFFARFRRHRTVLTDQQWKDKVRQIHTDDQLKALLDDAKRGR